MLKIINTGDPSVKPPLVMLVYGEGGVGKSTFAATAPKPLMADCENGSKYFGLRGIKLDVAHIEKWSDMREYTEALKKEGYETAVIDPIGELMEKLMRHMVAIGDSKLIQKDGSPSQAGWGWLRKTMRDYVKVLRDSGMHVLLVAHVDDKPDQDRVLLRPLITTKVSKDIVNMVDIVGYMTVVQTADGESKRVIFVDPSSDKFTAKDRTGQLGKIIEPDFSKIIKAVHGTTNYAWSKKPVVQEAKTEAPVAPTAPPVPDKRSADPNPAFEAARSKVAAAV